MADKCVNCTEKCPKSEMAHSAALGRMYATNELISLLKKVENGELVEVVRCKDCHWWRHINKRNGCGICQHEVFSVDDCTIDPVTEPTDFCSYGERREGE